MPARGVSRVTRTYLVTLMPDPHTAYDPFFVVLNYCPWRAAALDPTSSVATSQAFRAAIDVERRSRNTPWHRRFFCGGVEFVAESSATSTSTVPARRRPRHVTRRRSDRAGLSSGRAAMGGVHGG